MSQFPQRGCCLPWQPSCQQPIRCRAAGAIRADVRAATRAAVHAVVDATPLTALTPLTRTAAQPPTHIRAEGREG